jgi:hypothetical protein
MTSSPHHPSMTAALALRTIEERREDAVRRARVREIRVAQRAERRIARRDAQQAGAVPPANRPAPWWLFRFPHPAR